jgi:hypothetical protein
LRRERLVAVWVGARKFSGVTEDQGTETSKSTILAGHVSENSARERGNQRDHEKRGTHRKNRAPRRNGMDITWLTDRVAVGGGIWNAENMAKVAEAEVTHIIDMQIEFDDTPLAVEHGIAVLWNATDDDFEEKPIELFQRGVEFAEQALEAEGKVFIHCAAGVHRAPMMAVALLGTMGWELRDAMRLVETRRPVVDFPDVYVRSVREFLRTRERSFTTEDTEGHRE